MVVERGGRGEGFFGTFLLLYYFTVGLEGFLRMYRFNKFLRF